MNKKHSDTIAAISTPMGEGGIGIVRMSGPEAGRVAGHIFFSPAGALSGFPSHTIHYGEVIDPRTGEHVDQVLLTLMRSPRTYTREDVVEINCHGGVMALKKTLELCLENGARLAEPGEFTRRAFLNGRIDLSQAEAVIDIIQAKTETALKISLKQLEGSLAQKIRPFKAALIDILAAIEAAIDFPEEELEIIRYGEIIRQIKQIDKEIQELIQSCAEGRFFKEGIITVLAGKPNVGKSSILNSLLEEDRAIVTPVPGTTRDLIEEYLNIGGFPVRLVDTAGLSVGGCVVEKEGVRRSGNKIAEADLVLAVFDGSNPPGKEDTDLIERLKDKKVIAVINKSDLPGKFPLEILEKQWPQKKVLSISALKNKGIDKLKTAIVGLFSDTSFPVNERFVLTDVRHKNALIKTGKSLHNLQNSLNAKFSPEFLAVDLKESLDHLGDILGETTSEDILDRIFARFCIGK